MICMIKVIPVGHIQSCDNSNTVQNIMVTSVGGEERNTTQGGSKCTEYKRLHRRAARALSRL